MALFKDKVCHEIKGMEEISYYQVFVGFVFSTNNSNGLEYLIEELDLGFVGHALIVVSLIYYSSFFF